MYRKGIKRFIDFIIGLLALFFLFPLMLIIGLILSFHLKGNCFFVQQRPGLNGNIFRVVKFRTMSNRRDENGELLPDHERLSGFGKFIRKTSLDELPQLWNVLKGDMSLVGPRPLLVEYLPLYSDEQKRRHDVRPGITGWAQVNGRNAISWEKKFELDVWYVDNLSFALDVKIVLMTIMKVLEGRDIAQEGHVTMEKFRG